VRQSFPATPEPIIDKLKRLYGATVEGEGKNIMEFHLELVRSNLDLGHQDEPDSRSGNFKQMFDF
jgi:hypothetical protein